MSSLVVATAAAAASASPSRKRPREEEEKEGLAAPSDVAASAAPASVDAAVRAAIAAYPDSIESRLFVGDLPTDFNQPLSNASLHARERPFMLNTLSFFRNVQPSALYQLEEYECIRRVWNGYVASKQLLEGAAIRQLVQIANKFGYPDYYNPCIPLAKAILPLSEVLRVTFQVTTRQAQSMLVIVKQLPDFANTLRVLRDGPRRRLDVLFSALIRQYRKSIWYKLDNWRPTDGSMGEKMRLMAKHEDSRVMLPGTDGDNPVGYASYCSQWHIIGELHIHYMTATDPESVDLPAAYLPQDTSATTASSSSAGSALSALAAAAAPAPAHVSK